MRDNGCPQEPIAWGASVTITSSQGLRVCVCVHDRTHMRGQAQHEGAGTSVFSHYDYRWLARAGGQVSVSGWASTCSAVHSLRTLPPSHQPFSPWLHLSVEVSIGSSLALWLGSPRLGLLRLFKEEAPRDWPFLPKGTRWSPHPMV